LAAARPIVVDDGFDPHRGLVTLFKSYPVLWKRVSAAVTSVLPEQVERPFEHVRFRAKDIIGHGYWGFVYPTTVPRWVVKVTCDEQAGQIARLLLSKPKLRAHPGICFMRAAWGLSGYYIGTGRGHMPVSVIVRENLPDAPCTFPDVLSEDFSIAIQFGIASQQARRFNEAELLRLEAVEYKLWDAALAYAEARRDDYREYQRLLKLFAKYEAFKAPVGFMRKYLRASGEMLVDVTVSNMGWRAYDTQDVGGHPVGDEEHAVIRDAEHTDGREMPRPEYLPNR
jgi:hypothetical protein